MTTINTRTTHTATLEWPYKDRLSKDELVHKLKIGIPDYADIVGISIADVPRKKAGQPFPEVMRTLTITYIDDPILGHYRRR